MFHSLFGVCVIVQAHVQFLLFKVTDAVAIFYQRLGVYIEHSIVACCCCSLLGRHESAAATIAIVHGIGDRWVADEEVIALSLLFHELMLLPVHLDAAHDEDKDDEEKQADDG